MPEWKLKPFSVKECTKYCSQNVVEFVSENHMSPLRGLLVEYVCLVESKVVVVLSSPLQHLHYTHISIIFFISKEQWSVFDEIHKSKKLIFKAYKVTKSVPLNHTAVRSANQLHKQQQSMFTKIGFHMCCLITRCW